MNTATETTPKVGIAYQVINDRVLALLEKGVCPWRPGYSEGSFISAQNFQTRKKYRGINWFLLNSMGGGYWLTFNQAREHGGAVTKGSKGMPCVYFGQHTPKNASAGQQDFVGGEQAESSSAKAYKFLKYYTVFHQSQIEGIEFPPPPDVTKYDIEPIAAAQALLEQISPRTCPVRHGDDVNTPCYLPSLHIIKMPTFERYKQPAEYYSTLFHEIIHSTGKALERPLSAYMLDPEAYGEEELTAEMGACYLAAHCGIWHNAQENNAAYLQGWMKAIKADPKLLVVAAARAQKAVDYLLGEAGEL